MKRHKKMMTLGALLGAAVLLGTGIAWALPPQDQVAVRNSREGAYEPCYHLDDAGVAFVEAPPHGEDYEIQWEEPVVEAAVRTYLGKLEGPILHSDVWDIHIFDLGSGGVRILQKAKNGVFPTIAKTGQEDQAIDYDGKKLTSLRDFRHFDALQLLSVSGPSRYVGEITDVSGLEDLKNLTVLRLIQCARAGDLSPLAGCKQLQTLTLSGYGVKELSVVSGMTELRRLEISGTGAKDLKPLAPLQKLEYLTLCYALGDLREIEDYAPLGELKGLRMLDLTNNPVEDLSFCEDLPELETLQILGTPAAKNWRHWKEKLPEVQLRFAY